VIDRDGAADLVGGGRDVVEMPVPAASATVLGYAVTWAEAWPEWQRLRAAVGVTGRWPVVVGHFGAGAAERLAWGTDEGGPDRVLSRAAALGLTEALAVLGGDEAEDAAEIEEARGELGDLDDEQDGSYLDLVDVCDGYELLLLPDVRPEAAVAYVGAWAASEADGGHAALAAVLASWRGRHGAEVWTNQDTMLGLTVPRPPTDLSTAFELAAEQYRTFPCTTLLPGASIAEHARDLVGRREWFLHERP
jgi:hypothetical protein